MPIPDPHHSKSSLKKDDQQGRRRRSGGLGPVVKDRASGITRVWMKPNMHVILKNAMIVDRSLPLSRSNLRK